MAVSKRVRYEVLRRDSNTCRYCHATDAPLTVDHVVPVALGGSDEPGNLVAACRDCNAGKTSSHPDAPLVQQVADDAVRWSAAMKAAADRYIESREKADALHEFLYDEWMTCNDTYRWGKAQLPDDFEESLDVWVRGGAPVQLIKESIGVAMRNRMVETRNVWRYTCGVVWSKLAALQKEAAESLRGQTRRLDDAARTIIDCPRCVVQHRASECFEDGYSMGYDARETRREAGYRDSVFRALIAVVDGADLEWSGSAG